MTPILGQRFRKPHAPKAPHVLERIVKAIARFRVGSLSTSIGLDLGSSMTSMWLEGVGEVMSEPSVVAVREQDGTVLAIGEYAERMLGRTPAGIAAIRPIRSGVVADPELCRAYLRLFLQRALGKRVMFRPLVLCSIPADATVLERQATIRVVRGAGAGTVLLVDEPLAAAIGAGVQIHEPSGSVVIHLGAGTTEVAAVALGGVVHQRAMRLGSDEINRDLMHWIQAEHGVTIGEQTAEELRRFGGAPGLGDPDEPTEIVARDNESGTPSVVSLSRGQIQQVVLPRYKAMIALVQQVFRAVPPTFLNDVLDKGVLLTGGASLTPGFARFVSGELNVPATVAEQPDKVVLLGIAQILQHQDEYRHFLVDRVQEDTEGD